MNSLKNSLIYIFLWLLPKNLVSCFIGWLVSQNFPSFFTRFINKIFVKAFKLDMSEAQEPLEYYACLQDLFTRRLKPGLRSIASEKYIVSPCDGFLSEAGKIHDGLLLQIKGKYYALGDLLNSQKQAQRFLNGHFATIYLSPRDYHRFHVPLDGFIEESFYIPGTLWPVNRWAVAHIENLFCQNERIVSVIKSEHNNKKLAHVAVGACVVGKIKLAYCELESNVDSKSKELFHESIHVQRGQDLGVFMFGSTIILLFEPGLADDFLIKAPCKIHMGQALARLS